jgi:hypothetical protein
MAASSSCFTRATAFLYLPPSPHSLYLYVRGIHSQPPTSLKCLFLSLARPYSSRRLLSSVAFQPRLLCTFTSMLIRELRNAYTRGLNYVDKKNWGTGTFNARGKVYCCLLCRPALMSFLQSSISPWSCCCVERCRRRRCLLAGGWGGGGGIRATYYD